MQRFRIISIGVTACLAIGWAHRAMAADTEALRPFAKNAHYWQFKGKPVLLLGGSVEDNLFQIPNLTTHLDLLKSCGGNYVRNTMSSRDEGNVWPFQRIDGKYDLDQFNEEYWQRFETFLNETAAREIIVQIEVWATFDYYRDPWAKQNPFAPQNNSNYTTKTSGLPNRVNSHPLALKNPFVRSIPAEANLPVVLKYQEKFVKKMLSYSLRHGHVLYCMDNETAASPAWSAYWAKFILAHAEQAKRTVFLTEMRDPWNILDHKHDVTFNNPDLYEFVDVSQNNHNKGQKHYDLPLKRRKQLRNAPRPLNNVKVYGVDGGRFGNSRDGIERFWRNIFVGTASTRFHRPNGGLGLSKPARRNIQSARKVTNAFDIFHSEPRNDLLSGRKANEAYCLANHAGECAVYFPSMGEVTLTAGDAEKPVRIRWYAIDTGEWLPETTASGPKMKLKPPAVGQWAVLVQDEKVPKRNTP